MTRTRPPKLDAVPLGSRIGGMALLITLVLLAVARSHVGTRLDSTTVDEPWHIVAGVEYVRTGDFRLNPEHPPLTKLWTGAFMPAEFRLREPIALSGKEAERDFVEETFFYDNDFRAAHQRARIAMWSFNGLLMLGLGLLAWRALGLPWAAGLLAVLALEPTFAAHMPVVMTDLPLALALGWAALALGILATGWRWRWAIALGLAMGVALATKHSALPGIAALGALGTVLALAAAWPAWRARRQNAAGAPLAGPLAKRAAQLALAASLAFAVLWASYGFRFHAGPDGVDRFNQPIAAKIESLRLDTWRDRLSFLDAHRLLPRAYLWGLTDTVRAGVDGRGNAVNFLWGEDHYGPAPWFVFPSYIAAKVPLPLLALALVGLGTLAWRWRRGRPTDARPAEGMALLAMVALGAGHLAALTGSEGTYAGVRHALPVVMALMAFGAVAFASWRGRARVAFASVGTVALIATAALTLREPRLWEYHNELVGGTADAWRNFSNEGLDLGQRAYEIAAFNAETMAASGKPVYSRYWFGEEQAKALGIAFERRVKDLDDINVEGVYDGWFVFKTSVRLPDPAFDYDPAEFLAGLRVARRIGIVEIYQGRQVVPRARAIAMGEAVVKYIHQQQGSDFALIARRTQEILDVLPWAFPAAIELGNAHLKLNDRERALAAYRHPLEPGNDLGLDDNSRAALAARIAELESGAEPSTLTPLENPWRE